MNILQNKLEKEAEAFFEGDFTPIKSIYIDLEVLQDFYLGALLTFVETDAQLEYIKKNLVEYNKRCDHTVAKYFPDMNVSDEQIKEIVNDKSNHKLLTNISPMTALFYRLEDVIGDVYETNVKTEHRNPLSVVIGSSSINYDLQDRERFISAIREFDSEVRITFINGSLYDLSKTEIEVFGMYLIDDIEKMTVDERIGKPMMSEELRYINKHIFASPLITVRHTEMNDEGILETTKIGMGLYCKFDYIPRTSILI
jgi:hypothetical protein